MRAKFAEISPSVPTTVDVIWHDGYYMNRLEAIRLVPGSVLEVFVTSPPSKETADDDWLLPAWPS
jgi:hypothetical protein